MRKIGFDNKCSWFHLVFFVHLTPATSSRLRRTSLQICATGRRTSHGPPAVPKPQSHHDQQDGPEGIHPAEVECSQVVEQKQESEADEDDGGDRRLVPRLRCAVDHRIGGTKYRPCRRGARLPEHRIKSEQVRQWLAVL